MINGNKNDNEYDDIDSATALDGEVILKRIRDDHGRAPQINWGDIFLSWDIKRQNIYLRRFANSMNFACDMMQKERNEILEKALKQEKLLTNAVEMREREANVAQEQLIRDNAEKQSLYSQIVELKKANTRMEKQIRELTGGDQH